MNPDLLCDTPVAYGVEQSCLFPCLAMSDPREKAHMSSLFTGWSTYCSDDKGCVTYQMCFLIQLQKVKVPYRFLQMVNSVLVYATVCLFLYHHWHFYDKLKTYVTQWLTWCSQVLQVFLSFLKVKTFFWTLWTDLAFDIELVVNK